MSSSAAGAAGERALVEDLALALVREYLAKRKYKKTLETLQTELPVKPVPTTTTALAKALGITKFVQRNAKAEQPLPTLLDIFAQYMYDNFGRDAAAEGATVAAGAAPPAAKVSSSRSSSSSSSSSSSTRRTASLDAEEEDLSREMGRASLAGPGASSARTGFTSSSSSSSSSGGGAALRSPLSPSSLYGSSKSSSSTSSSMAGSGFTSSAASSRPGSASRTGRPSSSGSEISSSRSQAPSQDLLLEEEVDFDEELSSYDARKSASSSSSGSRAGGYGGGAGASAGGGGALPFTPVPPSTPVSLELAARAKNLIFGATHLTGTFTDPWLQQGFYFQPGDVTSKAPSLTSGLVQAQGGPCGILAVVQAYILKELLYAGPAASLTPAKRYGLLAPRDGAVLQNALVSALAEILWLVADGRVARCCTRNPSAPRLAGGPRKVAGLAFKPDGLTEALQVVELTSLAAVRNFFCANLGAYTSPAGCGVVMFLYSIVLTRSIENIESDRDEATSLIGAHSYCSQDLVALCLTGKARSNVFDGDKDLGGLLLRGIDRRASVGFLSLFEHYDNIAVGSFLKQPLYPIWVVCSESHYTVLFGLEKDLTAAPVAVPPGARFELYYYDQLAKQREEIRLSVDTTQRGPAPKPQGEDLEPPINECIRTKWGKNARIDWNGVEPIL